MAPAKHPLTRAFRAAKASVRQSNNIEAACETAVSRRAPTSVAGETKAG